MNVSPNFRNFLKVISCAVAALVVTCPARVTATGLTLTAAGISQHLELSTFATGFPSSSNVGPLGIGFPSGGGVLVSDFLGNVRLFPSDVDGQSAASAPIAQNYGGQNAKDLAKIGSSFYMTQGASGKIIELNADGTFNRNVISGINSPEGLVANPANNHLFVAAQGTSQILDVNPATGTSVVFHTVSAPDGISLSPDGQTLYVAATGTGHLLGFNTTTGATVFDSGPISGGIDGTAAGSGALADFVFANFNNGTVVEINLITLAQTVIATGGSRGDFVAVDPSNNTLMLTQTDRIMRLQGIPEPSSLVLLALGSAAMLGLARWGAGYQVRSGSLISVCAMPCAMVDCKH
jgi:DNA-binding beta-propeller fold protein YncE